MNSLKKWHLVIAMVGSSIVGTLWLLFVLHGLDIVPFSNPVTGYAIFATIGLMSGSVGAIFYYRFFNKADKR